MFEKVQTIFVIFIITFNVDFSLAARNNDGEDGNIYDHWKPIPGPPTSFTIQQSHPALGGGISSAATAAAAVPSTAALIQHQQHKQQQLSLQQAPVPAPALIAIAPSSSFLPQNSNHIRTAINEVSTVDNSGSADRSFSLIDDHHNSVINTAAEYKINSKLFPSTDFDEDTCSVDKYAFDHLGIVTYKNKIPKLDQFTICFWARYTNHTGDHTVFTYSVRDEPREIQIWVANSKGSSYVSMAIHGQSLYRLNYPMKMRQWHHTCTSWNGKTGEWQLWIKTERVGRGFHNRLVNHKIPTGGIAYSGGPSITGPIADGLHFEMTLLQIYKVALTAGKAHRNHKHHHVHRFNHDGLAPTTQPPPTIPPPSVQPMNPLLVNGQIPTRIKINLARPPINQQQMLPSPNPAVQGIPSQIISGIGAQNQATINTNFVSGQFHPGSRLISQQLISSVMPQQQQSPQEYQPNVDGLTFAQTQPSPAPQLINSANAPYVDDIDAAIGTRFIFKRDSSTNEKSITKREIKSTTGEDNNKDNENAQIDEYDDGGDEYDSNGRKIQKRGLITLENGLQIDEALLAHGYQFDGLAQFGLPDFKKGLRLHMSIEDEIKEHDKEPAEEEVKAVMNLCTACDIEPFKGAVAFTWKNAIVSIENALKGRSVGGCGYF